MFSKFYTASSSFLLVALIFAATTLAVLFVSASVSSNNPPTINLPPLNFGLASLRPHLTHEQVNLHYNAHQNGYVTFLKSWLESSTGETAQAINKLWSSYQNEVRSAEVQYIQNTGAAQLGDASKQAFNSANKLNKMNQSFVTFLATSANLPEGSKHKNFAGQVYNHALYFSSMTEEPILLADYLTAYQGTSPFAVAVKKQFGSAENFISAFESKAISHFGSGWIWLGLLRSTSKKQDYLFIMDTHDAQVFHDKLRLANEKKISVSTITTGSSSDDSSLQQIEVEYDLETDEVEPILVCDVWEHAYYVDYRQKRADYVKSWLKVVDWQRVDARFSSSPLNVEVRPYRLDDKERSKRLFNKKSASERQATELNDAYPHFV